MRSVWMILCVFLAVCLFIVNPRLDILQNLFARLETPVPLDDVSTIQGTSGSLFRMEVLRSYARGRRPHVLPSSFLPLFTDENGLNFPRCDYWAVITSVNPPTKTVEQLAAMSDLCVCVVADKKSPNDYGLHNVIYLTPRIQVCIPKRVRRNSKSTYCPLT